MMINKLTLAVFVCCFIQLAQAQNLTNVSVQIDWKETEERIYPTPEAINGIPIFSFPKAHMAFSKQGLWLPYYSVQKEIGVAGELEAQISNAVYESLPEGAAAQYWSAFLNETQLEANIHWQGNTPIAIANILPLRNNNGQIERLVAFDLLWKVRNPEAAALAQRGPENTYVSVLSEGEVYQIGITETGIFKLDVNFLKNTLGMSDIENSSSSRFHLYGNGGGMVPQLVSAPRADDLTENAVWIEDGGDGKLNSGDYILFYGVGTQPLSYNKSSNLFAKPLNIYADTSFYYIKLTDTPGLRVENGQNLAGSFPIVNESDFVSRYEDDRYNLLAVNSKSVTQGSGQQWFGDYFGQTAPKRTFTFDTPDLLSGEVGLEIIFAGSSNDSSKIQISHNGFIGSSGILRSDPSSGVWTFAQLNSTKQFTIPVSAANQFSIDLELKKIFAEVEGWLDYIQITGKRSLKWHNQQSVVFNRSTLNNSISTFQLSGAQNSLRVWDLRQTSKPQQLPTTLAGTTLQWSALTADSLAFFQVFDPASTLTSIQAFGKVDNQNLHGTEMADMIIVYHPLFKDAAEKLAAHRAAYNGYTVSLVSTTQVYHEFSSGKQDPGAIRDFARMVYDRDPNLKYLLLFGDGSFDARGRMAKIGNSSFVPCMETANSLIGISAFPWDDFFGLFSDNEGAYEGIGFTEIAIGRMPVTSAESAMQMTDKVIRYETGPERYGNWRNRLSFVGDDDEDNRHSKDCDIVANLLLANHPVFNQHKIYIDAFPKVPGAGGQRVPGASEAINNDMFRGLLAMVYLGHGGPSGWAQERILREEFIKTWNNSNTAPVMITATCTFSGFDNPFNVSAGEQCLLNAVGGPSAMLTTVRAVTVDDNKAITLAVCDTLFNKKNGVPVKVGDAVAFAKRRSSASITNDRRFCLLGDPAMTLANPRYNIKTVSINGVPVENAIDTAKALQTLTIKGFVANDIGETKTDFNGTLSVTIFDKPVILTSLMQDEDTPVVYSQQRNTLFNGAASVVNGKFEFTFVVPLDINYAVGLGKISYYATNGVDQDAHGFYPLLIGSADSNISNDDTPPSVEVFINNWEFTAGGKTDNTPVLLARVNDNLGISTSGTSIGHDLISVLNEDTQNTYILNDFFQSSLDDHTSGTVRYPLSALPEGRYSIMVRAWDVANNKGEGFTEFIVASDLALSLRDVLCFPNPLAEGDLHFGFEHDFGAEALDVNVEIFDLYGRIVANVETTVSSTGNQVRDVKWDGLDPKGGKLAQGVYVYRISVKRSGRSADETQVSKLEKLVMIK